MSEIQAIAPIVLIVMIVLIVRNCIKKNKVEGITDAEKKKNRKRAFLQGVIGYFALGILLVPFMMVEEKKVENTKAKNEQIQMQKESAMADKLMVSLDTYNKIKETFEISGLGKIKDVIFNGTFPSEDGTENENLFIVTLDKREDNGDNIILVTNDKGDFKSVTLNSQPIYDDGEIKTHAKNYFNMSISKKRETVHIAEQYIKEELKAPSTAVFCNINEYQWGKQGDLDIAVGWVESSNSFGVPVRTYYKIFIDGKNNTFNYRFSE